MKTINESAREYAVNQINDLKITYANEVCKETDINVCVSDFTAGVNFANLWIPVEEELPITFESGNWDGLRGSFVIVKDSFGEWYKARPYSGFLDGHNFYDWYSESDYMLSNITHWRPVERS